VAATVSTPRFTINIQTEDNSFIFGPQLNNLNNLRTR
jgi:hypothetical protein